MTRKNLGEYATQDLKAETLFDVVYRWIFMSTTLLVAPHEMLHDRALLDYTSKTFASIEQDVSPMFLTFPWLPTPTMLRRYYTIIRTVFKIKKIVGDRLKSGPMYNDALDFMIAQGDSEENLIRMVFSLLIAGLFNSGYNAAWVLTELFLHPEWLAKVRAEVVAAVDKCVPDNGEDFLDRLAQMKMTNWEQEFPVIDIVLKECIRMRTSGCLMRKNVTGGDMIVGKNVIPNDTYVMYHLRDIHFDSEIYANPDKWDPSRFMAARDEPSKMEHGYCGWGAGRHPCGKLYLCP